MPARPVRSLIHMLLLAVACGREAAAQVVIRDEPIPPAEAPAAPVASAPLEPSPEALAELYAPDRVEPGSVEAIREQTTDPKYLPESVAYLPDSETVPSPAEVLGHLVGAPDELSRVADVHGYFRKLAETSDRVRVEVVGTSEEGREILLATISDAANLADLPRFRETTARLADPRRTTREEARRLAEEGKVFYYLLGGLHSTETGSPEMLMELAYRLAVSERPEIRAIREDAIVLITPVVEPDGRDRQVDWYERHLRGKDLPFEDLAEISSPPYWGHYAFHDNNRDGMQLALALTRAVHETFYAHHPQVVHDLHESLPLLHISTGYGPYSRAIDPVTISEWTQLAHHEAGALAAMGLPGVWTWGFWDGWWPGYLFSVANNHNSTGRFYETFGNSLPGTFERDLSEVEFVGKPVTEVQWYRPWPPEEKVRWSLRNNTNYMQAGVLAALEYAARHRRELLQSFWVKGERSLAKGRTEAPYAWIFPPEQRDPARLAYLVNQLAAHRIEVHRLTGELAIGARTWPAGSWVVRMDQPYRNAAVTFLEEQKFPADEPNAPYDDIAWTWPLLYGVQGDRIDDRKVLEAAMEPMSAPVVAEGRVDGEGDVFLLRDTGQTALLQARALLGSHQVDATESAFEAGGVSYPPGSWIVQAPREVVTSVATRLGLTFAAVSLLPEVERHVVDLPRLALYQTWTATQDAGWARYTLDQAEVDYALIADADLRRGGLEERFDVILVPDTWGGFAEIVHGIDPKWSPLAYTKTSEYPSHGVPNAAEDVTGGMGLEGLLALQRFVQRGGVLVAIGSAGVLPVEGGLVRRVGSSTAGTPGSELTAKVLRPRHPIAYGYEELTSVFRGNGPIFEVPKSERGRVVVQFGTKEVEPAKAAAAKGMAPAEAVEEEDVEDQPPAPPAAEAAAGNETTGSDEAPKLVLSGFVKDEKAIDGKPAILDLPAGRGRVILFSFNPLHRHLNHSDFRFVYNAVLNWNDLPE